MTFYAKMNPDVKAMWLRALRSGEFQQSKNLLLRIDTAGNRKYCCLGVLCELAVDQAVIDKAHVRQGVNNGDHYMAYGAAFTSPPLPVMDWAGLDQGAAIHLTKLNDTAGRDFNQIANWIEAEL